MRLLSSCVATLLLAGCAASQGPQDAPFSFPKLPDVITVPDTPPPLLPAHGPVGRGALLYEHDPITTRLVLESGQQFSLPPPPHGEGRLGSMDAILSPDGRWLGYRKAAYTADKRYLVRDLTGARPTLEFAVKPRAWSPDARFFLASDASDTSKLILIEPAAAKMTRLGPDPGTPAVLPSGLVLATSSTVDGPRTLTLRGGSVNFTVTFAADSNHECWCPVTYELSPDGRRIAMQLRYENGMVPSTGKKTRARPDDGAIAVFDLATGAVLHRVPQPSPSPSGGPDTGRWGRLLADTGKGLLLSGASSQSIDLLLLDPATGHLTTLTRLPRRLNFATPGDLLYTGV